ncbi:MAG: signal protein PDZ, partial [Tannerellaceae bacterium]|nr:signal protein PDZ [Tannerellaceae bacterium]
PNYKPASVNTRTVATPVYRYDVARGSVEKFPFLDPSTPETDAEYLLQLGVRMIDKRLQARSRVVWECEANEMMSAAFRLENYAQAHIPLMLMQYPYVKYNRNPRFVLSRRTYNYTGLSYDVNTLGRILGVASGSPAANAGIAEGDVIEKIDNLTMEYSAEEYTAAYKQFITATMPYRDRSTLFADANGFGYCMYWDKFKYAQVAAAIKAQRNRAVFAYLFKYAPYVNPSGANVCRFNVQRRGEKLTVMVYPEVRTETTILVK